jgi:hypothetical protein
MKGIVSVSLSLLLLFILNISFARDIPIYLSSTQQNVNVGDEISVNVKIDPVFDLKGINVIISFDNRVLKYGSIAKSILIDNFSEDIVPDPEDINSADQGKIEYMSVMENPGPGIDLASSGSTILTVTFIAKAPGEAWIRLEDNNITLGDSMANAIPAVIDTDRHTTQIGEIYRVRVFSYPNPAPDNEGNVIIRCEALALLTELEAKIYDISGELVKSIDHIEDFDSSNAPIYEYVWNCKNEKDQDLANGAYILWLKATFSEDKTEAQTWKMAVLR